jgi:hypothetical protein
MFGAPAGVDGQGCLARSQEYRAIREVSRESRQCPNSLTPREV